MITKKASASEFFKSMNGKCVDEGLRIASLSHSLAACEVPTPTGHYDPGTHSLVFPLLDGRDARAQIQAARGNREEIDHVWPLVLGPLAKLHAANRDLSQLTAVDPLKHVTRRLADNRDHARHQAVMNLYERLRSSISVDITKFQPEVIHGDFHAGQIMVLPANTTSYIIDLDDVGIGVAEMDIANFVAHLVTSPSLNLPTWADCDVDRRIDTAFNSWLRYLCEVYNNASNRGLDQQRLSLYGSSALLRRALKLDTQPPRTISIESIIAGATKLYDQSQFSRA